MRKLLLATVLLAIGVSPCAARGGHGRFAHGHSIHGHSVHGHSTRALSAPANPSVPPALTSDARLTGNAPLPSRRRSKKADTGAPEKRDPEDAQIDQRIRSICRGC